jgi:hypothetical protein
MPWVRLDDAFHAHPKLAALGARTLPAVGLYVIALTWSSTYLTDGLVPDGQLRKLGGTTALARALVEAGLWERVGAPTASMTTSTTTPPVSGSSASGRWMPSASGGAAPPGGIRADTTPDVEVDRAPDTRVESTRNPIVPFPIPFP